MPSSCELLEGFQILNHLISVIKETNARSKDCTQKQMGKLQATGFLKCWILQMVKKRWMKGKKKKVVLYQPFLRFRWPLLDTQIHILSSFEEAKHFNRCVEYSNVQLRFSYSKTSRKQQDVNRHELIFFCNFPLLLFIFQSFSWKDKHSSMKYYSNLIL